MRVYKVAAAAAMLIVLPVTQAFAESTSDTACWRPDEISAAKIQSLQALLLVQALKCKRTIPETLDDYNKFMTSKHDVIVADKHVMQAHFVRTLGATDGITASSDYDTKLSNDTSSPIITVAACEKSGAYSRIASTASDADLLVLADTIAPTAGLNACPVAVVVTDKPSAMVIDVWKRPDPVPPFEAGPAVVPAAIVTTAQPQAIAAVAPAPDGPPQAKQADAVAALQAAVTALNQATASLRASQAGAAAAPTSEF